MMPTSKTKRETLFFKMLYIAIAGIAINSPINVVNKAVEIPAANSAGFGDEVLLAITLKDRIIPWTVPNSPIIGLNVPINAM